MDSSELPVVILAGGRGMRMENTQNLPKPLVPIGPYPVVQHVMNIYAFYGYKNFIFSVGYKASEIQDFFKKNAPKDMNIIFVDTGLETPTGGRVKGVEKHIETDEFFVTYCDGLADINIQHEYQYHKKMGKIGTMTVVHPMSPFGIVKFNGNGLVTSFKEKPFMPSYINGGFFVFNKKFFDYLEMNSTLEEEPLRKLAEKEQLTAYKHEDFWMCMDTLKDVKRLNDLWSTGVMPHTGYRGKPPWTNLKK